jgi:copper chaperone CopZ
MARLIAITLLLAATLSAGLAFSDTDTERTSTFRVEGMTCGLCPKAIEKSLSGVQGVRSVKVDQKAERVTVVATAALAADRLVQAIESAGGFEAELISLP